MSDLQKLKTSILEDGIIDEQEVKQLREVLYDDGEIDQEEANILFELNDEVSGKENHPSWTDLLTEAICDFLLNDENSPGEIDKEEADWLLNKIQGDGQIDATEKQLLITLKEKAKAFPSELEKLIN